MRISIELNDSGCFNSSRYESIKVFLDDKLVEDPITADEELGYVRYRLCDSGGKLILGKDTSGDNCLTIEEKHGKVRVELVLRKDVSGDTSLIKQEKHGKVRIEPKKFSRISVEKDDPGYDVEACIDVKVFLDDALVKYPITADAKLGYVKYFRCDGEGQTAISGVK